jgi:hypothetical protein
MSVDGKLKAIKHSEQLTCSPSEVKRRCAHCGTGEKNWSNTSSFAKVTALYR